MLSNATQAYYGVGGQKTQEVGLHLGFADVHHFSRVFKQIAGVAPSKYAAAEYLPHRKVEE
jgi:AraC-like DNA-binding protein